MRSRRLSGVRFRHHRRELGLTLAQAAERAGLSTGMWSKIEHRADFAIINDLESTGHSARPTGHRSLSRISGRTRGHLCARRRRISYRTPWDPRRASIRITRAQCRQTLYGRTLPHHPDDRIRRVPDFPTCRHGIYLCASGTRNLPPRGSHIRAWRRRFIVFRCRRRHNGPEKLVRLPCRLLSVIVQSRESV